MRQYTIKIYPENRLTILLFKNVTNTNEIKDGLQNGLWDWAVANCKPIFDHQQILIAATKSISAFSESKKPESFNINKDMINRLSPSGNFADSLTNFGLNADDKEFFVFLMNATQEKIDQVKSNIKGEEIDISIETKNIYFNPDFAKKVYKISDIELPNELSTSNNELYLEKLKGLIINNMAVKGLL
ncbi:hypothetical protein RB653_002971 [Dictyostelium firmibasis]|uniref:EKC/KEOPS complex subunit cgi121 n=1 Tax=Dictyostelium firmibasis TaxID=79012 RepID=A0AAN7TYC8_9MYCE